jgi:L-ascorbate metabolism protein UlaG (beta-lactamase superfamily)
VGKITAQTFIQAHLANASTDMASSPSDQNNGDRKVSMATRVARSGLRRYPSELTDSILNAARATSAFALDIPATSPEGLGAAWLGHASVLVRLGGRWILTDPVFSERIGIKLGPFTFGVGRLAPTVDLLTLPTPDLILISHAHFDHLDQPTLAKLAGRETTVITAPGTKRLIPSGFSRVIELPWERSIRFGGLSIAAMTPAHWGARTVWDRHRSYNSYVIEHHHGKVLFAGDTAMTSEYEKVRGADLTIFGIGAYDPWITNHATPEQAWEMHASAQGRFMLPMHHSTFKLSDEPAHEPMQRLMAAAGDAADRVVGTTLGRFVSIDQR